MIREMFVFAQCKSVADPGFPGGGGGGNPRGDSKKLLLGKVFAENCVKVKEIGSRSGRLSLESPLIRQCKWTLQVW